MVCLRRLCKRYRCWTTLTKMEESTEEGGCWGRRDPLSCPPTGHRQWSSDPVQQGLGLIAEVSAAWGWKAGFSG